MTLGIICSWPLLTQGILSLCHSQPDVEVIWSCEGHIKAVQKIQYLEPDILLIYAVSPEIDVDFMLRRLGDLGTRSKVVLLVEQGSKHLAYYLQLGAKACIDKSGDWDTVVVTLRQVARGEYTGLTTSGRKRSQPKASRDVMGLTPRELQVLRLMAYGEDNQKIADALYISMKTVKNHITNILRKLEVKDRTQAVILYLKAGEC